MNHSPLETLLGAVVVVIAVGFLIFAFSVTDSRAVAGYELAARFERVDGLELGADVRMGGIKIGTVRSQSLDPQTYVAIVRFSVNNAIKVPADSSASIESEGLLGGRYLNVVPGGDDRMLKPGEEIRFTQASVSLEQLFGKFLGGGITMPPAPVAQPK
ncbi:MAG: outer membrane lipid asymmetry maintenance protein MlaD [Alphaproteobacteria bacterium]|nr:outer membrane lipid asymmetry maintenance protein MlaD [Alphaproteobacteria bacterium]